MKKYLISALFVIIIGSCTEKDEAIFEGVDICKYRGKTVKEFLVDLNRMGYYYTGPSYENVIYGYIFFYKDSIDIDFVIDDFKKIPMDKAISDSILIHNKALNSKIDGIYISHTNKHILIAGFYKDKIFKKKPIG